MMSPQVISGACLLALLIVQTCCYPQPGKDAPGGSDPTSFNAPYANVPPGSAVYNRAPAGVPSPPAPAAAAPVFSRPADASVSSHALPSEVSPGGPVKYSSPGFSQPGFSQPGFSQPGFSQPGFSQPGFSQPGFSQPGFSQPGFSQPGGSSNSGPSWSVPPLGASSHPESLGFVSPPRPPPPPPEPSYQAGELSQYERNIEDGVYETETEEQGYLPPPPLPPMLPYGAGKSFTSQPRPPPRFYGGWGFFPYYDYRFLYGQYPPGTYTHVSSDFEHGNDNWQDAHYERYYAPYGSDPGQQTEPFSSGGGGAAADPQVSQAPRQPANYQGYPPNVGPSGVVWYRQDAAPVLGHPGGSNVVKAN